MLYVPDSLIEGFSTVNVTVFPFNSAITLTSWPSILTVAVDLLFSFTTVAPSISKDTPLTEFIISPPFELFSVFLLIVNLISFLIPM